MANGNGNGNGAWWIHLWRTVVAAGVIAAIGNGLLLWKDAAVQSNRIDNLWATIGELRTSIRDNETAIDHTNQTVGDLRWSIIQYIQSTRTPQPSSPMYVPNSDP